MTEEEKRQEDIEKYRNFCMEFGHFAIGYENLIFWIKVCIKYIMQRAHNNILHQQYSMVLLADQPAGQLIEKLRTLVSIHFEDKPEVIGHLDKLLKYCLLLNEERNDHIHGFWQYTEYPEEKGYRKSMTRTKEKRKRDKMDFRQKEFSAEYFEQLGDKTWQAVRLFKILVGCFYSGNIIEIIPIEEIEKVNPKTITDSINK